MNKSRTVTGSYAFTLIEVLIVSGIISILVVVSMPLYNYLLTFSTLDSAKTEVLSIVRLAQNKAKSGENNSNFGVFFEPTQYTLYQGDSHALRDQNYDKIYELPEHAQASDLQEINFNIKTGLPQVTGILVLTNTISNNTEIISINEVGFIY